MKHPLRSTGTHQTARLLRAIAPGHFRLDERSMQDLITAAHSYARMLSYVAPNGKPDGDWAAFWEVENLTYMAVLAAIDTRQLRRDYDAIDFEWGQALQEERERPLKSKKKGSAEPTSPQYLRRALCQLRDMASRLEKHYSTLREAVPLKAHILSLIRKGSAFEYVPDEVESLLQQLVGYHKGADDHLDALSYREFWQPDFRWGIRDRDEYDCVLPVEDCAREQARELFVRLHNIFITLQAHAQRMFEEELARIEQPEEALERRLEPHIALFIAFLRLFRHAQDGMNDLPRRHLDFYYNSVLCLDRKPAQPDHAYLIFTLAKEFEQELVEKGTLLLAGKDKKGRPIQFETLERWKVTKASIEEIRNTAITPDYINAATVAEKGAPPAAPFRPFGDDGSAPTGELGFAIASPQLLLLEGKREVTITMELAGKIEYANIFASEVQVKYSTGEGYHDLPKLSADKEGNFNGFVLNPVVAPFEPLKTVEPARRILSELVSDEVMAAFSAGANSPSLERVLHDLQQRYTQAASNSPMNAPPDVDTAAWFQDNFYYPALSGIYLASTILRQNEEPAGQGGTDEYRAQLYFYRAYYLWCLASICCPAPQFTASATSNNKDFQTSIPDLTSITLTAQTPPLGLSQCFVLGRLYLQVINDLLDSLKALTGKAISTPDNLSDFKSEAPASNTSINIYTVCAMLSRFYMQVGEWGACLKWSQFITASGRYEAGEPDNNREDTATRVFESIFTEVETSREVIWAMNAVAGNETGGVGNSSLFSILGSRDLFVASTGTLYFKESPLLNEVNKQNLRYDDRSWPEPQAPSTGSSTTGSQGAEDAQALKAASAPKASKKKAAAAADTIDPETNPYDYRDKVAYREEGSGNWFTEKYFLSPTAPYVPMIRLAEIMLNEAWCALQVGGTGSNNAAREILNTLRERAGALPFLKESDNPGADAHQVDTITSAHVEEERMRELAFEGDRRDFVRLARSIMAKRDYVVNSADAGVLVLGPQTYLPPAQNTLLLTPNGVAKAPINWDSSWLYMADMLPQPAQVNLSSIKDLELSSSLTLSLTLKEDAPAFLPDPLLLASHGVQHPVIRITFNGTDKQGKGSGFYNFLQNQTLAKATITTKVSGIQKSLILQNDFGVFDGTQRFYPFGPIPENSARFFLGCQEAFSKKLSKVSIDFDWVEDETIAKGLRGYENVYEHYQSLSIPIPHSTVVAPGHAFFPFFTAGLSPLNMPVARSAQINTQQTAAAAAISAIAYPMPRLTIDLLKDADFSVNRILSETSWFDPVLAFESTAKLAAHKSKMRASFHDLSVTQFSRASTFEQVSKYSATQKRGFLKFTLVGDFGHTAYPKLVMDAASKQPAGPIPHEPYTPATNSVSLSYESTQVMEDPKPGAPRLDYFFHLLPFGGMVEASFDGKTSLVYGYPSPATEPATGGFFPANLFLGMKNLLPGDNLFITRLFAEHTRYTSFGRRWSVETGLKARVSLPRSKPPYFNNQALGYAGNFVRGYEYYVADGLDFGILRTSVHLELLNREFQLGQWMPFKAFKVLPIKVYLAANNDLGYANDPHYGAGNTQSNRLLYGYGPGLDIVMWYNKTLRFEYSRNDLGRAGLYIRVNAGF